MRNRKSLTPEQREQKNVKKREDYNKRKNDPEYQAMRRRWYERTYEKNREKLIKKAVLYTKRNRERFPEKRREWIAKNRERIRELDRKRNAGRKSYYKERYATNIQVRIRRSLAARIHAALKAQNLKKKDRTLNYLGCSIDEFKGFLEDKFKQGMTWENHGKWHIDHIKPCCSFNLADPKEAAKCFHFTNLQPLWQHENQSKGGKILAGSFGEIIHD